jgi:hypothetical protein
MCVLYVIGGRMGGGGVKMVLSELIKVKITN